MTMRTIGNIPYVTLLMLTFILGTHVHIKQAPNAAQRPQVCEDCSEDVSDPDEYLDYCPEDCCGEDETNDGDDENGAHPTQAV